MSLNVTIPETFSGPLDLLLHLIRRDEMDIHDIPIAKLTSAYLEEMGKLDLVDVDEGAEFLDLASRLLEIKSRMLLPPEEVQEEDENEDEAFDPRSDLVEALLEYRRFKEAARLLGEMAEEHGRRYPRIAPRMEIDFIPEETEPADVMDLFAAFQTMLLKIVPSGDSTEITYTEVPTSVRIEQIETVLLSAGKTRFSLLLSEQPTRREMVGFFIAILELVRQGRVIARQSTAFADIVLEKREPPLVVSKAGAILRKAAWVTFSRKKKSVALPKHRHACFPAMPVAVVCTRKKRASGIPLFLPLCVSRKNKRKSLPRGKVSFPAP